MVICLGRGADLHMAQLMPLPLTVSCFKKIQIGFTFLVLADLGSPGKRAVKRVRARVRACVRVCLTMQFFLCMPCHAICYAVSKILTDTPFFSQWQSLTFEVGQSRHFDKAL